MAWAWKEGEKDRLLAMGDAYLQGVFESQVWKPDHAVADDRGVMQLAGVDVDRHGRLRAREIIFHVPWSNVSSFLRDRVPIPDVVRESNPFAGHPDLVDVVALHFDEGAEPRRLTLVVLQNPEMWVSACRRMQVPEDVADDPC